MFSFPLLHPGLTDREVPEARPRSGETPTGPAAACHRAASAPEVCPGPADDHPSPRAPRRIGGGSRRHYSGVVPFWYCIRSNPNCID